jgi:mersacidin/lichenicidin family type 2 lantibiotic
MNDKSAGVASAGFDNPEQVFGRIYAMFMLDHIVELVARLAYDVVKRPAQFASLQGGTATALESFRTRLGKHPDWPDASQRGEIFDLFLGPPFTAASSAFRLTVLRFAEGATDVTREIHENALLDSGAAIQGLLEPTRHQATQTGHRQLAAIFGQAVSVLQDTEVRQAFGKFARPDQSWPLAAASSPDESRLLDALFRTLMEGASCQGWGRYYFATLQRVAHFGRITLDAILTEPTHDAKWAKSVVDSGYRWIRALNDLLPVQSVIRAWREPSFRSQLTEAQRLHLPPHPAGEIDTSNAHLTPPVDAGPQPAAGQTFTVSGEICCSTTPSVSCMSHCPPPGPGPIIGAPSTYPCCTHHC